MQGKKLLVADDSLTIQKVIKLALSNEGYEIQTVSDGNDALQQISLFRPDVVLVDISLPEQSAFELMEATNAQPDLSEVRFVLMSSAYEKVDEAAYKKLGFHGRLTKPFDPAHLRQVLNETLEQARSKRLEKTSFLEMPPPPLPKNDPLWQEMPLFPPPPGRKQGSEEDIKELTESTIKMSGLDDLQWSVEERAKKPEPPSPLLDSDPEETLDPILPPLPKMGELGETRFLLDEMTDPPPLRYPEPGLSARESYHATEIELPAETEFETHFESIPPVVAISTEQMESMMRTQLQETLEKMARQMLPEIAEKIIKQEINRMLSEQA